MNDQDKKRLNELNQKKADKSISKEEEKERVKLHKEYNEEVTPGQSTPNPNEPRVA